MLQVKNLDLELNGNSILHQIQFDVEFGEIVSIIGPSGCGKTSILKAIAGIHKTPDASIILDDKDISKLPIEARDTTLVFQDFVLFPHMTVAENMSVANPDVKLHKSLFRALGICGHYEKYPHQLSGGEQQRIALARAIAYKPRLLLLDEPFSNVDAITTKSIRETVKKLLKRYKITTIMVTHDIEDVWTIADKVMVIDSGENVGFGTPGELYDNPQNLFVAQKMGRVVEVNNNLYRPENIQLKLATNESTHKYKLIKVQAFGLYNIVKVSIEKNTIELVDFNKEFESGQWVELEFGKPIKE